MPFFDVDSEVGDMAKTTAYGLIGCLTLLSVATTPVRAAEKPSNFSGVSTVDPFIRLVAQGDVSALSLAISDEHYANAQSLSAQSMDQDSVYQKLGSYEVCLLNNDMINGVLMRVAGSLDSDFVDQTDSGRQLRMYNAKTQSNIRIILVVKPAGWSASQQAFGGVSGASRPTQGVPFVVGLPIDDGKQQALFLQEKSDKMLGASQLLSNLALDSYGAVNHFGLNAGLQASQVVESWSSDRSEQYFEGCLGDYDPSFSKSMASMVVNIAIYMNVSDLASAVAGRYETQYTMYWADSNDLSQSEVVYQTA